MLNIAFNVDQVIRDLDDVAKKQVPFALALTLNRTQEERQRLFQRRIITNLTIREGSTQGLFMRAVSFGRADRADKNKGKYTAAIRILGGNTSVGPQLSGFRRIGQMIIRQDEGGTRVGHGLVRAGNKLVEAGHIIPAEGLRTRSRGVPRKLYPKQLGLAMRRTTEGGFGFAKRKKRTKKNTTTYFTIPGAGIFQREHLAGGSETSAVWWFRKQINLPARLQLDRTFHDGIDQQLRTNFDGFLTYALRTAKR